MENPITPARGKLNCDSVLAHGVLRELLHSLLFRHLFLMLFDVVFGRVLLAGFQFG
jgi:hypothetical protein